MIPASSPVAVVGGALIDGAPAWAKDTAITLFGTADKVALVIGILIVLLFVGAGIGLLERWRSPVGRIAAVALGIVGIIAAITRAGASGLSWLPAAVAGGAAALAVGILVRRFAARADDEVAAKTGSNRRDFLVWSGAATLIGIATAAGGTALRVSSQAADAARRALKLPAAAVKAAPIPAGAELSIGGLPPVVTPNADFYRIDTALIVPDVAVADWSLRIHGLVDNEVTLTWDELVALPLEESVTTLMCVSNEVGGSLVGNALWLGYPLRELLAKAGPQAGADMVLSTSIDGFTASSPLEALTDDRNAILAVGMNGEPLPAEHGFPVRMVVPGLYGYVSATKWVVDLEVTRFADATAYWTDRGWSERGPIKIASRINVPQSGNNVAAGDAVIAGFAWQQHTGISAVEVQIDDGPWQQATLATAISDDTWVQWSMPWSAKAGDHSIRCRATNANGEVQTEQEAPPAPDGSSGWDRISVTVR
nr:molybdopterin-dependent oxidoreductase [Microbacterium halimionae]